MSNRYPCGGLRRRDFLAGTLAGASLPALGALRVSAQEPEGKAAATGPGARIADRLGIPGPWPGRVVEVKNPAMIRDDKKDREAVAASVARGMKDLTGAEDAVEAWRTLFEPGDVVGIKMNPVGNPLANTSSELMWAVIDGLKSAGVKPKDMIVFERYQSEFINAGMSRDVPDGIAWTGLTAWNDNTQLEIAGPRGSNPLSGYDRDEFVTMELVHHGHDPKDDRTRRSHLGLLVTRRVNKLVLLPVLKDHGSAGITGALKNMSHGLVNNVARSHSTAHTNACNQFTPEIVAHPILRKKCVLQIMDGIKGVFQGGPHASNPKLTWEYNALFFATDPVAMDAIEWQIIDAKRKQEGLPPVAATGRAVNDPLGTENFDVRQPQHVALSAHLGLGHFDRKRIDHRVIQIDPAASS